MKASVCNFWLLAATLLVTCILVGCRDGVHQSRKRCPEGFEIPHPLRDSGAAGCYRVDFMNGVEVSQLLDEELRPWGTLISKENKANGPFKLYYENGKTYRHGNAVGGNVDGTLTTYWPNGIVQRKDPFAAGRQSGTQYFYDSLGQLLSELTLVDDSRTGVAKWYHAADVLQSESIWFNGYQHDRAFGYDVIGNLIWMEYNSLDCDGKPCLEYAILWDEAGKAIDSSGRAIETGDATVYERIRSGKYCPSLPVDKERLRYLLGASCD